MKSESPDPRAGAGGADEQAPHRCLSSLADGEADALAPGCALWRDDGAARERWHVYHLIGDVLRSDELASAPGRDAAFVAGLRERLAREPVPLAPAAPATPPADAARAAGRSAHLGWRAPAAAAAGFFVVAGALVLTRAPAPPGAAPAGPVVATTGVAVDASTRVPAVPAVLPARPEPRLVLSGRQLRDPELDAYVRAHQTARGGAPAALPGGALRSVEMAVIAAPASSRAAPAGGGAASGAIK